MHGLYCPECPRPVEFPNKELLKMHLCATHFQCLAYACTVCGDRFAIHQLLGEHYLVVHGLTDQPLDQDRDTSEEMRTQRRHVNALVLAAECQQRGEAGNLDDATAITAPDHGGNPITASGGFGLQRPHFMRPFTRLAATRTLPPQHQQQSTASSTAQAPDAVEMGFGERDGAHVNHPNPAAAVQQDRVGVQRRAPDQQQAANGDDGMRECQQCDPGTRVANNYAALREHAFRHAGHLATATVQERQRRLREWMGLCFPGSRVRDDMTCNEPGCWKVLEGRIAWARHLQYTHVQEEHMRSADLALSCPADDCPLHVQQFPSVKALKEHVKRDHKAGVTQLTREMKRRLDEMVVLADDLTTGVRRRYFPYTPKR